MTEMDEKHKKLNYYSNKLETANNILFVLIFIVLLYLCLQHEYRSNYRF